MPTEENLRDWIVKAVPPSPKQKRYVSKHNPDPNRAASSFGPNRVSSPADAARRSKPKKDAVPRRHERPVHGLKTEKNYIEANAIEAILQVPAKTYGSEQVRYVNKKGYGKRPAYLDRVQGEIQREKETIRKALEEKEQVQEVSQSSPKKLTNEERAEMLDKLKAKWDEVNREYQKQTHIVDLDTEIRIKRKERFENELSELEWAIDKLSRLGPF